MVATGLALALALALAAPAAIATAAATAATTTTLHGGGRGTCSSGGGTGSGRGGVTRTCWYMLQGVHFLSGIKELIGHGGCSVNSNTGRVSSSVEMAATCRQAVL